MSKTPGPRTVSPSTRTGICRTVPTGQTVSQWPTSNCSDCSARARGRANSVPADTRPGKWRTDIPVCSSSDANIPSTAATAAGSSEGDSASARRRNRSTMSWRLSCK
jgi:hypothetical protein